MKKMILLLTAVFAFINVKAREMESFGFSTSIGTAVSMSTPASVPVLWQVTGYYNFNRRLSAGVGTGLSFYEKVLIPVFADVRYLIIRLKKFTPYIECAAGYGFAAGKGTAGGLFLNPSVGVQYSVCGNKKIWY